MSNVVSYFALSSSKVILNSDYWNFDNFLRKESENDEEGEGSFRNYEIRRLLATKYRELFTFQCSLVFEVTL